MFQVNELPMDELLRGVADFHTFREISTTSVTTFVTRDARLAVIRFQPERQEWIRGVLVSEKP